VSAPLASLSASKDVVVSVAASLSPDLTSLPVSSSAGLGAPTHLREASRGMVDFRQPLEPSDAIDRAGELPSSVACLPHRELGLPTVSGECTVGWGSMRCTPCRGSGTGEPPPAVPRRVLRARLGSRVPHRARTTHRSGPRPAAGQAGCGPREQATGPCQAGRA
jgi:hypothetical protein